MGYIVFLSVLLSAFIGALAANAEIGALIGGLAFLFGLFVGVTGQELEQKKGKQQ